MLNKVLLDTNCDFELALAWCINAKNSLINVHGFSPYQLAIGTNPDLPTSHNDKLPALTSQPSSKVVADNLQMIHKTREAFIASENSEKIRRALSHNVRTTADVHYLTGDSVYYKRASSQKWHGPGRVLGQDGQQVLVKHGSVYIRVHPCRLQLTSNSEQTHTEPKPPEQSTPELTTREHMNEQSDSESETEAEPITQHHQNNVIPEAPEQSTNIEHQVNKAINNTEISIPQQPTTTNQNRKLKHKLKPNTQIRYKTNLEDKWKTSKITSRAGKATGQYSEWWNTESDDGKQSH